MRTLLTAIALLAPAWTLAAQSTSATVADIRRLQDAVFEASNDIARLRTGDAALKADLGAELDDIREEVTYLKVGLRKHTPVTADVRGLLNRIDRVRHRARGSETVTAAGGAPNSAAPEPRQPPPLRIPPGTELEAQLLTTVSPRSLTGERIEAATSRVLAIAGTVVIPAGSLVRGEIVDGRGQVSLRFDQIVIDFFTHPIKGALVSTPVVTRTDLPIGTEVTLRFEALE